MPATPAIRFLLVHDVQFETITGLQHPPFCLRMQ